MRIELVTGSRITIGRFDIPDYNITPRYILHSNRVFVLEDPEVGVPVYKEVAHVYVLSPNQIGNVVDPPDTEA